MHDQPGVDMYVLARWSVIARLADAEGSGGTVIDLGPDALLLAQAAQRSESASASCCTSVRGRGRIDPVASSCPG